MISASRSQRIVESSPFATSMGELYCGEKMYLSSESASREALRRSWQFAASSRALYAVSSFGSMPDSFADS